MAGCQHFVLNTWLYYPHTVFGLGFPHTWALHRVWPAHSWCLMHTAVYSRTQPRLPQEESRLAFPCGAAGLSGVMDTYCSLPTCLTFPTERRIKWLFGSLSAHISLSKLLRSPFVGRTCHTKHPSLLLSVGVCFLLCLHHRAEAQKPCQVPSAY